MNLFYDRMNWIKRGSCVESETRGGSWRWLVNNWIIHWWLKRNNWRSQSEEGEGGRRIFERWCHLLRLTRQNEDFRDEDAPSMIVGARRKEEMRSRWWWEEENDRRRRAARVDFLLLSPDCSSSDWRLCVSLWLVYRMLSSPLLINSFQLTPCNKDSVSIVISSAVRKMKRLHTFGVTLKISRLKERRREGSDWLKLEPNEKKNQKNNDSVAVCRSASWWRCFKFFCFLHSSSFRTKSNRQEWISCCYRLCCGSWLVIKIEERLAESWDRRPKGTRPPGWTFLLLTVRQWRQSASLGVVDGRESEMSDSHTRFTHRREIRGSDDMTFFVVESRKLDANKNFFFLPTTMKAAAGCCRDAVS